MSDAPQQDDELNNILWTAITASVTASINAPEGTIDTTDRSIEHFETAKKAIQAMILEARLEENESIELVLQHEIDQPNHCHLHDKHVLQCHNCKTKKWRAVFCNEELVSLRLRIADLKAQLEQLKGVQG